MPVCYLAYMISIVRTYLRLDRSGSLWFLFVLLVTSAEAIAAMTLKNAGFFLPAVLAISFAIGRLGSKPARIFLLFAIPACNAVPALINPALPFNYIPTLLMILAGLALSRPQTFRECTGLPLFRRYFLWLSITLLGAMFLVLRWSTLGEDARLTFPDLVTSPVGDRLSFSLIFPILTLCLYGLSPLLLGLKVTLAIDTRNYYLPLACGFFFSALLAALQQYGPFAWFTRPAWTGIGHSNGLASDFNGLGLISGFMFFFSLQFLFDQHRQALATMEKLAAAIALPLSLACAWWSHSRTALLVFLTATTWMLFRPAWRKFIHRWRFAFLSLPLLLALALLVFPRTPVKILKALAPAPSQTWTMKIDYLSNGRLTMLTDGWQTFLRHPVSGIGPGNYLFYQRYKHFGHAFLHDLPLNQFLLILLEGGLLSLGLFIYFLSDWFGHRSPSWIWPMSAMIISFLVGTPLWLPEGMVLFWLIISLGYAPPQKSKSTRRSLLSAIVLATISCLGAVAQFKALDPSSWQNLLHQPNDYGLWEPDPGMDRLFRWSKRQSGLFISGQDDFKPRIYCGAPLPRLPEKKQTVQIYWKGRPLQKLIFSENTSQVVELPPGEAGWLEFVVEPVFNLKEMKLGPETRTLGVQIHFDRP